MTTGRHCPKLLRRRHGGERWQVSGRGNSRPWPARSIRWSDRGRAGTNSRAEVRKTVEPVVAFARKLSEKHDAPEADLLAALPLLGRDPATRAEDLKRLAGMLAATRPAAVQSAAVAALARIDGQGRPAGAHRRVGQRVAGTAHAGSSMRSWPAPRGMPSFSRAIEKGSIPAGQIDAARRQRLTDHPDARSATRAAKLFAAGTSADRQKVIDDYKTALALKRRQDPRKGRVRQVVFRVPPTRRRRLTRSARTSPCIANKSPLYLLSEILDPSRNLDSRYAEYQAITKDERTITGILVTETATAITLRGQQGKEETILRSDLDSLRGSGEVPHARGAGEGRGEAGHGRPARVPDDSRPAAQEARRQRPGRDRDE